MTTVDCERIMSTLSKERKLYFHQSSFYIKIKGGKGVKRELTLFISLLITLNSLFRSLN